MRKFDSKTDLALNIIIEILLNNTLFIIIIRNRNSQNIFNTLKKKLFIVKCCLLNGSQGVL